MIVQAIGLLDDLDKELNTYAMRVREWYGWHFPEMSKILSDNVVYAKVVRGMRLAPTKYVCTLAHEDAERPLAHELRKLLVRRQVKNCSYCSAMTSTNIFACHVGERGVCCCRTVWAPVPLSFVTRQMMRVVQRSGWCTPWKCNVIRCALLMCAPVTSR